MRANSIHSAFTLLELILVMMILAIAAATVFPSLRAFAISRSTDNAAQQVLVLATYAHTQAVNEGRMYHLNFDTHDRQVWLTEQDPDTGEYVAPGNDFGDRFTLPTGMTMTVDVQPQPNTLLVVPVTVQQNTVNSTVPYGQPVATNSNPIIENAHTTDGTYMEFQPSGRMDPGHVHLTDSLGNVVDLGCATSTESMHMLTPQELR